MDLVSFPVYFLCLVPPLFLVFIFRKKGVLERSFVNLISFFPSFLFASIRDVSVGTDTRVYYHYFSNFIVRDKLGLDQLFYYFLKFVHDLGGSFHVFLAFQAFFCWVLFSIGAARIDRSVPLLAIGLLPVLMVDATFNGMRYGMAFAVAAFLYPILVEAKPLMSGLLCLVPGFFHSSMLIFSFIRASTLFLFLPIAIIATLRQPSILNYFNYKFLDYAAISRPSSFSGIFPLFQIFIVFLIIKKCNVKIRIGFNICFISCVTIFFAICLLPFSMAALRLIQIGIFLLVVGVSSDIKYSASFTVDLLILFLGILGVSNFLRQLFWVGAKGQRFFCAL